METPRCPGTVCVLELRIHLDPERAASFTLRPLVTKPAGCYTLDAAAKPPQAVKPLANGARVVVRRIVAGDNAHEIVAAYHGAMEDLGDARFALGNVYLDLVEIGLLARPICS